MNGKTSPSAGVLKRLHAVLFRRSNMYEKQSTRKLRYSWAVGLEPVD